MEKEKDINKRLARLHDIIGEAREIIAELEEYAKGKDVLNDIPVESLSVGDGAIQTRFLNICQHGYIRNIRELIDCGSSQFRKMRNSGNKTTDMVADALKRQYNVEW